MTRAYDEIYLDDAMETLGEATEYATLFGGVTGQEFLELFVASGLAEEFGSGNVSYLSGMSGIELASLILRKCGKPAPPVDELPYTDYPPEYWVGWILAYYQWYSGRSFSAVLKKLSFEDLLARYNVLHEADPSKAAAVLDGFFEKTGETNLSKRRKERGLSQSQLAAAAEISIRSVQLYEQRRADINKAQYNHLFSMARVLGCKVEDLLES